MLRKFLSRFAVREGDGPAGKASRARKAGRFAEAESLLREHLVAHPSDLAALHELGLVLAAVDRHQEAVACFDGVLARDPASPEASFNRGISLRRLGNSVDALASFDHVIACDSRFPAASRERGNAQLALGRADAAIASYEAALAVDPEDVEALANLGQALLSCRRHGEAMAAFERALLLRDDLPALHRGRATALMHAGRHHDALAEYEVALACDPADLDAALGCAAVLHYVGRTPDALAMYERLQQQYPERVSLFYNRGILLRALGRREDAIAAFREAIARDPAHRDALNNLGIVLGEGSRFAEAAASYEQLLAIDPHYPHAAGNLAYALASTADWRDRDALVARIEQDVRAARAPCVPFVLLSLTADADEQLGCASGHVAARHPQATVALWTGERYAHPRIRVAYVSADFREHAVSYLIAGLLERHDRGVFEISGIALGGDDGSATRARIASACEHFVDVGRASDLEVAALLRREAFDIVVDLMGHTGHSRPGIFAHRPAPVQVNYLGYPGTMGAPYIDYIVADRFVIPEGRHSAYAEKVVYLPDSFQANDRDGRPMVPEASARADAGLPDDRFVYCCFNNTYKITPAMFDVWMRILHGVPNGVLWLVAADAQVAGNLRREAARRGITPDRLIFAGRTPYATYLGRLALADLFLDTLPFNGGTTVSDALWAGLPVLTQAGDAFAARMAGSLLHAAGMPELITDSAEAYEATAIRLATERGELAGYRGKLAQGRTQFPLFNTERFCVHLEAAFRTMCAQARRGLPPVSFTVDPADAPET